MLTNYELLADARDYLRGQVSGLAPESDLAESWDEFFSVYDAIIRRFAVAGGVPAHEVDECSQEVWTSVVAHLDRFRPDPSRGRFRTWLYQIVRSKATDLVRSRVRGSALSLNDSRYDIDIPDDDFSESTSELEQSWKRESLRVLLADLEQQVSPVSFQLFELRAVQGWTFDELAETYQMKPTAVRTRYHRTLKRFRDIRQRYTDREA